MNAGSNTFLMVEGYRWQIVIWLIKIRWLRTEVKTFEGNFIYF
jgi:hypothetical protein